MILGLQDPGWLDFAPPVSARAAPLAWSDDPVRPVVRVLATGEIVAGGLRAPPGAKGAELGALSGWLAAQAAAMAKHAPWGAGGAEVPRSPLLVCADARAPFERVLELMLLCSQRGVRIGNLRLAARLPGGEPGMLAIPLPLESDERPPER